MRIAKALKLVLIALALAALLCARMVWLANSAPVQRNLTLHWSLLPPGTPPLRVVLLSDFHVARVGDTPERLRETVARVDALHPDIVVLAGDFVSSQDLGGYPVRRSVAPLAGLHPRLGVFAVLGNHDYPHPEVIRKSLAEVGVRALDNDAARAGPLAIVGIGDAFSGHDLVPTAVIAAKRVGGVPIVFTHSPDVVPDLPAALPLTLAGHTHCGQIALPMVGAPVTQSRFGQRYACGIIRESQRVTIVTAGLGVSRVPFRLGALPDYWVIDLVPLISPPPAPISAPRSPRPVPAPRPGSPATAVSPQPAG